MVQTWILSNGYTRGNGITKHVVGACNTCNEHSECNYGVLDKVMKTCIMNHVPNVSFRLHSSHADDRSWTHSPCYLALLWIAYVQKCWTSLGKTNCCKAHSSGVKKMIRLKHKSNASNYSLKLRLARHPTFMCFVIPCPRCMKNTIFIFPSRPAKQCIEHLVISLRMWRFHLIIPIWVS